MGDAIRSIRSGYPISVRTPCRSRDCQHLDNVCLVDMLSISRLLTLDGTKVSCIWTSKYYSNSIAIKTLVLAFWCIWVGYTFVSSIKCYKQTTTWGYNLAQIRISDQAIIFIKPNWLTFSGGGDERCDTRTPTKAWQMINSYFWSVLSHDIAWRFEHC